MSTKRTDSAAKPQVEGGKLKAKVWPALTEAIEQGVAYGWRHGLKHLNPPAWAEAKREVICEAIYGAVLNEICERFEIDDAE